MGASLEPGPDPQARGLRALQLACALAVLLGAQALAGVAVNLPRESCPECEGPASGSLPLTLPAFYLLLPAGIAAVASGLLRGRHLPVAVGSVGLWAVGLAWVLALWIPNAANGAIALHPQADWLPPVTLVPEWFIPLWVAIIAAAEALFLLVALARFVRARRPRYVATPEDAVRKDDIAPAS